MTRPALNACASAGLGLGLMLAMPAAGVTDSPPPHEYALERTPSGHLVMEAVIDGLGPYRFVLDTGASWTAIAQYTVNEMEAQIDRPERAVQALTNVFEADHYILHDVRVDGIALGDLDSVVLPSDEGPLPVVGYFATDAFQATHYTIDFANERLITHGERPAYADGRYDASQGLVFAAARMGTNRNEILVMIDTGSSRSFMNGAAARFLRRTGMSVNITEIGGVDERHALEIAEERQIRDLRFGGVCLSRSILLESNLDLFHSLNWNTRPAMLVGMDLLHDATLNVDRESGVVEISSQDPRKQCREDRRVQLEPRIDSPS